MTVSYVTTRPANQLTLERCKSVALQCKRSLPGEWPHVSKCGLKDTGQEGVGETVKATHECCQVHAGPLCQTVVTGNAGDDNKGASRPQSTGYMLTMFAWDASITKGLRNGYSMFTMIRVLLSAGGFQINRSFRTPHR